MSVRSGCGSEVSRETWTIANNARTLRIASPVECGALQLM